MSPCAGPRPRTTSPRDSAIVSEGTRVRAAAGRGCSCRAARTGAHGVLRPRPPARPGRSRAGRHGEVPAPCRPLPEPPDGLHAPVPRLDLAAARSRPARASRGAPRRFRWCSTRTASATAAWAGERADEVNRPLRQALGAADHVLYQSEFSKRSADMFLGEPSRRLGGPLQRRRHRPLPPCGRATAGRARGAAGRRPVPGVQARAGVARLRACCTPRTRMPGCSSPAGWRPGPRRCWTSSGSPPPSSSSAGTRSATRLRCCGVRTSICTRRSTIPARAP